MIKPKVPHSTFRIFSIILALLVPRRRLQLGLLFGLSILGALGEIASLGAVLPFLVVLTNPERVLDLPYLEAFLSGLGWTEADSIILPVTFLFGFLVVAAAVIRLLLAWAINKFAQALGHDLTVQLLDRTLHQPYSYHTSHNSSEVIAGIEKVSAVVGGILIPGLDALVATVMVAAILVGLIVIDWVVALFAGGLFGTIYLIIGGASHGYLTRGSRKLSAAVSARVQCMQEGLGGIRDILLDGTQRIHVNRFQLADSIFRQTLVQNTLWAQTPRYLVEAFGIAIVAGLAVTTALKAGRIMDAIPIVGALALGAQKLLPLLQRIYAGWSSIIGHLGYLEDVAKFASASLPVGSGVKGDSMLLPFKRVLTLVGVGFRYRTDAPTVLQNIHLNIPKGSRIGISGETGCGKSTLLDLIMGLLSPTEGSLEVDGVPLTPENSRHWQARIAHVPQSIFLADSSLKANIAFGEDPNCIDIGRVESAARRARIHEFISSLDEGYDTMVGERGVRLSGGQRQRVGIARALYRNADVLILDEATSALDENTEASVMEGISGIGNGITMIIVAHRLSTIEGCDFVVKMTPRGIKVQHAVEIAKL